MADDHTQRQYRTNEYARPSGKTPANDPLAELARLIGQSDPFAEFGRRQPQATEDAAARPATHQDWAPQPGAADPDPLQGTPEAGDYDRAPAYEGDAYYQNDPYTEGRAEYDDVPPRRRLGIIAIAAVLALAVVGSAGAYGYRALFGASGSSPPPVIKADATPAKVVPPSKSEPQSSKLIYDRVGERSAGEKLVSREEQPVEIAKPTQTSLLPAAGQAPVAPAAANLSALDQPKKIHTIVIRPDQPQTASADPAAMPAPRVAAVPTPAPAPAPAPPSRASAPQRLASAPPITTTDADSAAPAARPSVRQAAPSRNAPLSLNPNAQTQVSAPAEPVRTASAPPVVTPAPAASGTGHYAVQISSQRSEADAQAAFRTLQAKYPAQLSGRQPIIRRADLGSKGIYYRALVGPFASASEASGLCQSLKAAGGSCLIQKN